jgi:hypothetical protein
MVIYYRSWNLEQGWTTPVDIIYRGRLLNAVVQDALVDEWGTLHLVFFEGDPNTGTLQYSSAPAAQARQARAWSRPVLITEGAGPITAAILASLRPGNLTVLFSGQVDGFGLYEIHSDDRGATWSQPEIVFLTNSTNNWVAAIRAYLDERGWLHTVWGVINDDGNGDAVYYAKFDRETARWEHLTTLATREGNDYSTTWPAVITDKSGQVIVVYQDSFPAAKFVRISKDGGKSWSAPSRPFEHVGEYEHPVLLKDSSGTVHMVLGNRLSGDPEIYGMWYSVWQNNSWSDLEPISTGPQTQSFSPSAPKGVISRGNLILASWWHDRPNEYRTGAWYSYITLDAPRVPVATPWILPTEPAQIPTATTVSPSPELAPATSGTALPEMESAPPGLAGQSQVSAYISISLLPALLLLILVFLYRKYMSQ